MKKNRIILLALIGILALAAASYFLFFSKDTPMESLINVPEQPPAKTEEKDGLNLTDATGKPGETVFLELSINSKTEIGNFGISFDYDSSKASFAGFSDFGEVLENSVFQTRGVDQEKGLIVAGYSPAQALHGAICKLSFRLPEGVSNETIPIHAELKDPTQELILTAEGTITVIS